MIFGIAVGDVNGVLVAFRDIGATEGKTRRVEVMEALLNVFLGTAIDIQKMKWKLGLQPQVPENLR